MSDAATRFRAPGLGLTLLLAAATLVCAGLGTWQVKRHFWKTELIASRNARVDMPPIGVAELAGDEVAYRRLQFTGRYDAARSFIVHREPNELRAGVRLFSPLVLAAPVANVEAILVDRGWLPHDQLDAVLAATAAETSATDTALITPMSLTDAEPGTAEAREEWLYFDPRYHGVHAQRGLPYALAPFLLLRDAGETDAYPRGGYERPKSFVDHRAYAAMWFAMSLAAAGLWVGLGFERARRADS